jgi:CubicO group peptidase (beta-lactamase class C family)
VANPLEQVASWPATAAVGVVSAAGPTASTGPLDLPFAWASVTKLLVALAALGGVQRGLLDLDGTAGIDDPAPAVARIGSRAS